MQSPAGITAALLCCLLAACGEHGGQPATTLQVVRTAPASDQPILLNQELTVYFSAAVDPLTITHESVCVLDADGQKVPGRLDVGTHAVTFVPRPPLRPDLDDGSFRPDGEYRLQIAGYPRPDAVRGRDGRMLPERHQRTFRSVPRTTQPLGLPSPLAPVADPSLPFLLQNEAFQPLPADQPRLLLHFTLPVLPTSLSVDALEVALLRAGTVSQPRLVQPIGMRLLDGLSPAGFYGCALEVDLGRDLHLEPHDLVTVTVKNGATALLDYAGRPVQALAPSWWQVEAGSSVSVYEWPEADARVPADPVLPGFEVRLDRSLRPQLRAEAGDGCLGVLRPAHDLELRPGVPFDRGDGVLVQSQGDDFPFLGIDIPVGVTVRLADGTAPFRLRAVGAIRIAGRLLACRSGSEPPFRSGDRVAVADLMAAVPVSLLAGGDLTITGTLAHADGREAGRASFALIAGGAMDIQGELPPAAVLAVETRGRMRVRAAEDAMPVVVGLTSAAPAGLHCRVQATSTWQPLPPGLASVRVELDGQDGVAIALQTTPSDPLNAAVPDTRPAQMAPPIDMRHGDRLPLPPTGWFRLVLTAEVDAGRPLPGFGRLRLRRE